jgi:hypothetical protein
VRSVNESSFPPATARRLKSFRDVLPDASGPCKVNEFRILVRLPGIPNSPFEMRKECVNAFLTNPACKRGTRSKRPLAVSLGGVPRLRVGLPCIFAKYVPHPCVNASYLHNWNGGEDRVLLEPERKKLTSEFILVGRTKS